MCTGDAVQDVGRLAPQSVLHDVLKARLCRRCLEDEVTELAVAELCRCRLPAGRRQLRERPDL
eukprot:6109502-Heterocapsa_arctica.AAC.1